MFQSVRARLTWWYTAILALVLITFSGISYAFLARAIRASTDAAMAATAREFASAFSADPAAASGASVPLDFRYSDRALMVMTPSGTIVTASRTLTPAESAAVSDFVHRGSGGFATVGGAAERGGIRVLAMPIRVLSQPYFAVVSQPLHDQDQRLQSAARAVFIGIPLALIVAAAGGYVMARKSLAPVTTMSLKARQIGAETLDERIEIENERDELGFLALTLNDLLERLQQAFDLQRRFMADASHELRTPMAIIQGEADVALSRERASVEYQESLRIIQRASCKLTHIVQNLFLLARSDSERYPVHRSRFYLDELLHECVQSMRTVAASGHVALDCQTPSDLLIVGDEELLHRCILNLLDNAVKFVPPGGRVQVAAERQNDGYAVRVSDSGPGIPEADQTRVFERFFRGDRVGPARSPAGGGLGLPIARWIAEFHGGSLTLERSGPGGSVFLLVLPQGTAQDSGGDDVTPAHPDTAIGR